MGTKFDDGEFIKSVERFPCLYDKRDKHYKNVPVVQNTWKQVSDKFNVPADVCIQRWMNIRHRYAKERRKIRSQTPEGNGCSTWPYYGDCSFLDEVVLSRRTSCTMMLSMYKNLPSPAQIVKTESITMEDPLIVDEVAFSSEIANIVNSDEILSESHRMPSSCPSDRTASTPSPAEEVHHRKKKQKTEGCLISASSTSGDRLEEGQDEDMLFGKSIGITLKKVTSQKNKLAAKAKIMMLLSEYVDSD